MDRTDFSFIIKSSIVACVFLTLVFGVMTFFTLLFSVVSSNPYLIFAGTLVGAVSFISGCVFFVDILVKVIDWEIFKVRE